MKTQRKHKKDQHQDNKHKTSECLLLFQRIASLILGPGIIPVSLPDPALPLRYKEGCGISGHNPVHNLLQTHPEW